MTVFNSDLFEVSLLDDVYVLKDKSHQRKYYYLNAKQYDLFRTRITKGCLTLEDIQDIYCNDSIVTSAEEIIDKIEAMLKPQMPKKEKHVILFKRINTVLNAIDATPVGFLFKKKFLFCVYLGCVTSLFFIFFNHLLLNSDLSVNGFYISWMGLNILLHELGHILALRFYKREVLGVGFKLVYVFPYFFIRTTDIVMCGRKERILVSFMGPTMNILLGIVIFFFGLIFDDTSLFGLTIVSYFLALSSFIPFLKSDGYRMIGDAVNEPKLSEHSFVLLQNLLRRRKMKFSRLTWLYCSYILLNLIIIGLLVLSLIKFIFR